MTVFLDRQLKGQLLFDIFYDRSLAPSAEQAGIQAPLFQALGVQRQKGMLALQASHDLALRPVGEPDETQATRVGENQLPAFVRDEVTMTVAHTFSTPMRSLGSWSKRRPRKWCQVSSMLRSTR